MAAAEKVVARLLKTRDHRGGDSTVILYMTLEETIITTLAHYYITFYMFILYVNYWIISKYFSEFRLVDQDGNKVGARVEGLLLSNGGTVCGDGFSDNSADAICREMGFPGRFSWRRQNIVIWSSFRNTLDVSVSLTKYNVLCRSGEFTSCTYNLEHNCDLWNDVFLACDTNNTGEWAIRSARELPPQIRCLVPPNFRLPPKRFPGELR